MTLTIELTSEEETRLQRRAARMGLTPAEYVRRTLAVRPVVKRAPRAAVAEAKTGSEIMAELKRKGIFGAGYGDPSIDSPVLARQIRAEVWSTSKPDAAQ